MGGLLTRLIDALQVLPGVGPKSAQRMALALLQKDRDGAQRLAEDLTHALDGVRECKRCRNLTDDEAGLCDVCQDPQRNAALVCVVESVSDVFAIEQAGGYSGTYFVMHGRLSPIDGIGPDELQLTLLQERVAQESVEEVIIATNATVEGEATAHYIRELVNASVSTITRIAQGIPVGGELEYADGGTIMHALQGRKSLA